MSHNLDQYVKLGAIGLAIAGIYYFVIALPSKNNSDILAMKQKCQDAGEKFYNKLTAGVGIMANGLPDDNYGSPIYAYNKSLNTCLISYLDVSNIFKSSSDLIDDSLTSNHVLSHSRTSNYDGPKDDYYSYTDHKSLDYFQYDQRQKQLMNDN